MQSKFKGNALNLRLKSFITMTPRTNVIKLFTAVSNEFPNKLECCLLSSLSSQAYCLRARPGAYPRVEHLKGVSLGWASTLPANTIQSWRGLQGANTLTYYENS